MNLIEKKWTAQVFSSFVMISALIIMMQFFLQITRELRYLSEHYSIFQMTIDILLDQMLSLFELAPVILYISSLMTNDRWKELGYFRNALLAGMTNKSWWRLTFMQLICMISCCMVLWIGLIPKMSYQLKEARIIHHGQKKPSFETDRLYLIGQSTMYINPIAAEPQIFNIEKKQSENHDIEEINYWEKKYTDLKIGADKLSFKKKMRYLHDGVTVTDSQDPQLRASVAKDYLYIISLVAAIIASSRDRQKDMVLDRRSVAKKPWITRIITTISIYWGVKILPNAARFFHTTPLIIGYSLILPFIIK